MPVRPARVLPVAVVAALSLAVGTASADRALPSGASGGAGRVSSSGTSIADCSGHRHARPRTLVLACGDGGAFLRGVHWAGWGANTAQGFGSFVVNTCDPNCADGGHRATKAVASAAGRRGGRYTTLVVRAESSGQLLGHWSLRADGPVHR